MKKKNLLSFLACILLSVPVYGQWNPDPAINLMISKEGDKEQSMVKAEPTPDGKIFVSWLKWEDGMNAYIKLQLMDKEGNAYFDEGGIYVSQKQTETWTAGYDLKVTPDGCAILACTDSRNDNERHSFETYVYKIDQDGNFLWGLDGIRLPDYKSKAMRPQIGITNAGVVFVGYHDFYSVSVDEDMEADDQFTYNIMRINDDGTLAWAEPLRMNGVYGNFTPCEEEDLYLTILSNGLTVHRLDPYGDDVWGGGLVVDNRDVNSRNEIYPVPDGKGNIVLAYQRYIDLSNAKACMQRVSPDGELMMGLTAIDLWDEYGIHSLPGLALDPGREEIVAYWDWEYRTTDTSVTSTLCLNKYSYNGDALWEEPKQIESEEMWGYASCAGHMLDDGSVIAVYGDRSGPVQCQVTIRKFDIDGNTLWKETMGVKNSLILEEPEGIFDQEEMYIFWSDDREKKGTAGYGSVYGHKLRYEDGKCVGIKTTDLNADMNIAFSKNILSVNAPANGQLFIYDLNGALIQTANIYAGANNVAINTQPGVYVAKVIAGNKIQNHKVFVK